MTQEVKKKKKKKCKQMCSTLNLKLHKYMFLQFAHIKGWTSVLCCLALIKGPDISASTEENSSIH